MHVVEGAVLYDKLPGARRLYHRSSDAKSHRKLKSELGAGCSWMVLGLGLGLGNLGVQPLTFWARSPERCSMIWRNHTQTPYMRRSACGTKHSGFQCRTDLRQPCRCTTVIGSRTKILYSARVQYSACVYYLFSLTLLPSHADTDTQIHTRTPILLPGDARLMTTTGRMCLPHAQKIAHPPSHNLHAQVSLRAGCHVATVGPRRSRPRFPLVSGLHRSMR